MFSFVTGMFTGSIRKTLFGLCCQRRQRDAINVREQVPCQPLALTAMNGLGSQRSILLKRCHSPSSHTRRDYSVDQRQTCFINSRKCAYYWTIAVRVAFVSSGGWRMRPTGSRGDVGGSRRVWIECDLAIYGSLSKRCWYRVWTTYCDWQTLTVHIIMYLCVCVRVCACEVNWSCLSGLSRILYIITQSDWYC